MPKEAREKFALYISKYRTKNGLSQEDLATLLETTQQTVGRWETAESFPRPKTWKLIADRTGIDPVFFTEQHKIFELLSNDTECPEFMCLPKYRARLSGDRGELRVEDKIDTMLAFRHEWIKTLGDVEDLVLFHISCNCMCPTINEGDVVMVDKTVSVDDIIPGNIYAFSEDNLVSIKRLIYQGGKLMAVCDNKDTFQPYEIDIDRFALIGRVVWSGHEYK